MELNPLLNGDYTGYFILLIFHKNVEVLQYGERKCLGMFFSTYVYEQSVRLGLEALVWKR